MEIDFTPFFKKYKELSVAADGVFNRVTKEYPECVKCKIECSDCCHALFDLTLIEAIYINHQFNNQFDGKERDKIIEKANSADRDIYKLKRKAHKELEAGKNETDILMKMAFERVRCPLLNENERCDLYEYRPITCRLYGLPTSIGGISHTCGQSGFVEGKKYPTVKLDIIHNKLYDISAQFVKEIKSKYVKMSDMIVPLSMALCTDYNEEHLGIKDENKEDIKEKDQD